MTTEQKQKDEVKSYIIDKLEDGVATDSDVSDLHHHVANEDYFCTYYSEAEEFLADEVFGSIEKIKEYEQDNFGEVNTDFSDSCKVANMLAYILAEEILGESEVYQELQMEGGDLSEEDCARLIADLRGEEGE